jgi:hypothetical protein
MARVLNMFVESADAAGMMRRRLNIVNGYAGEQGSSMRKTGYLVNEFYRLVKELLKRYDEQGTGNDELFGLPLDWVASARKVLDLAEGKGDEGE